MNKNYELAIIGAGAAGCTAAIYAGRSGVKTVVFDKGSGGGLMFTAPKIENYPGFKEITGMELATRFIEHARRYADIHMGEEVKNIKKTSDAFLIETDKDTYEVKAVILSTGSNPRKLGVDGEEKLAGKGVSYCATCDGFFFRGKKVAVVGGGNTALLDAIYLKQIGCKEVYLIHRRDALRGEKALQIEAEEKGIKILLSRKVKKIEGRENVESIVMENITDGKEETLDIDGVFIAVGEEPENKLAKILNLDMDEEGYVKVDRFQRTSVRGVYAAGDITGGIRQVITSAAEGAIAALTSLESLGKKYPY